MEQRSKCRFLFLSLVFFDREDAYLPAEDLVDEGKRFWETLKQDGIETRLQVAVDELIPIVMKGHPGRELYALVEEKVKEVVNCKLPAVGEKLLGILKPNNKAIVNLWMCPSRKLCGKSGNSPTARYCKDVDSAVLGGKH
jgi:hypothetical protein